MDTRKSTSRIWISGVLLLGLGVFGYGQVSASGWNDFSSDIGHGFKISKTSSFTVCLGLMDRGPEIICPHPGTGDYGPIRDYVFTDTHLLVRTFGAKPSPQIAGTFTTDPDRHHYFIVDRHIENPYTYQPIGPLDEDIFLAHALVPTELHWQTPTNPDSSAALLGVLMFFGISLLILGWPVILALGGVFLFFLVRKFIQGRNTGKIHSV